MERKWRVAVVGATGMVGQRFVSLLADHPWFEIAVVAASARSAGKTYEEAVADRWAFDWPIPQNIRPLIVRDASDVEGITGDVDFVFCAVDMKKDEIRALEDAYARSETPVVSNNSAHRGTPDVPMIVPALTALYDLKPTRVVVSTYQAISGAGKTFKRWPEMIDNVIPYIGGEEEKSEQEPLKIWGHIENGVIVPAKSPIISAHCVRVAVADGHLATCWASFEKPATKEEIIERWRSFEGLPQKMNLPSAPHPFLQYFEEDNRPQTHLDRDFEHGMGISLGRLRGDSLFDWRFVGLSHNTLRGAAGGAVLIAELLCAQGYIPKK